MNVPNELVEIVKEISGLLAKGEAREAYEKLLKHHSYPGIEENWYLLTGAALQHMHSYRAARKFYLEHRRILPSDQRAEHLLIAIEQKLNQPLKGGRFAECNRDNILTFAEIRKQHPDKVEEVVDLGGTRILAKLRECYLMPPFGLVAWEGLILAESVMRMEFSDVCYSLLMFGEDKVAPRELESVLSLCCGYEDRNPEAWKNRHLWRLELAIKHGFAGHIFAPSDQEFVVRALESFSISEDRIVKSTSSAVFSSAIWVVLDSKDRGLESE